MGCIVNGPGEMADADFGYVGGAPGKINLYVGKTPMKFNIPEAEAVERLVDLIQGTRQVGRAGSSGATVCRSGSRHYAVSLTMIGEAITL